MAASVSQLNLPGRFFARCAGVMRCLSQAERQLSTESAPVASIARAGMRSILLSASEAGLEWRFGPLLLGLAKPSQTQRLASLWRARALRFFSARFEKIRRSYRAMFHDGTSVRSRLHYLFLNKADNATAPAPGGRVPSQGSLSGRCS
jgi:hypothetical protein